jgi:hypothetical protein
MKLLIPVGSTSNILQIFIQDSSSSLGAGLVSVRASSASFTAFYHRDVDTTATSISLTTMTIGTFTSSGFAEIDQTNMPGWYQFCPPSSCFAASAKNVGIHLKGVTNMAPLPIEAQIVSVDVNDSVRAGLTALPNAAAEASGGIITRGTGTGQLTVTSGQAAVTSNIKKNSASRITFVMTDSSTHAPVTGKTVTVQRSLDGAALATAANSPATEIGSGLYTIVLAAADTNADELAYRMTASGADDLVIERVTQP